MIICTHYTQHNIIHVSCENRIYDTSRVSTGEIVFNKIIIHNIFSKTVITAK